MWKFICMEFGGFRAMTCLSNFCKVQILRKLPQCMSLVRKTSVQANAKVEKPTYKPKNKDRYWISPQLTALRIQEIKSVTGIVAGLSYISWVKVSVPELHLLDWNLKILPQDFVNKIDESRILGLAYEVKDSLPDSDVYVMESSPVRESRLRVTLNKIQLCSMLTVLLNGFYKESDWKEKVIFQKMFVMNYLYDIQIASERISTRSIVENILLKSTYLADGDLIDSSSSKYPTITVDYEYIEKFRQCNLEKQETLSLALLLTLSFIDVNLFRNQKSLDKILKRKKNSDKI